MTEQRDFERYLEAFRQSGTPDELAEIFRRWPLREIVKMCEASGSPEEVRALVIILKERSEAWEWNRKFWAGVREWLKIGGLMGGVLGAVAAAGAVYRLFLG